MVTNTTYVIRVYSKTMNVYASQRYLTNTIPRYGRKEVFSHIMYEARKKFIVSLTAWMIVARNC